MKITFLMNDKTEFSIEDDFTGEDIAEWADLMSRDDGTLVEVGRVLKAAKRNRKWVRARDIKSVQLIDEIPAEPPKIELVEKEGEKDESNSVLETHKHKG